jgi:uncharacterized protein DUF4350
MRPPSASRIVRLVAWVALIGGFSALLFFGWQTFRWRLETGDTFPEYSTYRADPKGMKAFYESLLATDLMHISRRTQSSKILPSGDNQVLVLAGIRADQPTVADDDSRLFEHWLTTGGRIILALRPEKNQPDGIQAAPPENQDETDHPPVVSWRSLFRRWGVEAVPLSGMHSATADSTLFGKISRWLGRDSFERLTSDWKVIGVQDGKNVIVERAFARGSLVLLADSYPLSNEGLATNRNTGFLLWLMDNRSGVLFDETHLGLSERPGIMTLAQRYGLQGTLISIVAVLLLFIWKCQYTLVPRTRIAQDGLTVSGCSSDQAFLNLLRRNVSQKQLVSVCLRTWLKTARPTPAHLARLEKFGADSGEKKSVVERYNRIITLLNEKL